MDEMNVTNETLETAAPAAESMDAMSDALDASMRKIEVGDIIDCTVVGITDTEVTVDLAYAAEGIIRPQDYSGDTSFSIKENVHPGDEIKAKVIRLDDGKGNLLLSRREAMDELAWEELKQMMDSKTAAELTVREAVKGGVVGFLHGIRAFVPASKVALDYVEDLSIYVGKTIPVRVIQAEKEGRKLVLSSREILRDMKNAKKAEALNNIKVGLVTEGKVASIQSYGAFVNLGEGIDGLLHISQITSNGKRLKTPADVLSVGDTVKVKVTKVDNGRISLSQRAAEEKAPVEKVSEEKVVIPKAEKLTTNLGSLLKGIKLD